jgi:hypothetical protein
MNRDFIDLLQAFAAADVRFLVVGAYALAAHGRPRGTGDLDVWVDPTPENASRVMRALSAFGAPVTEIQEADFAEPGIALELGVPPGRVDILTDLTGLAFVDAWPSRFDARSATSTWTSSAWIRSFATSAPWAARKIWRTSKVFRSPRCPSQEGASPDDRPTLGRRRVRTSTAERIRRRSGDACRRRPPGRPASLRRRWQR